MPAILSREAHPRPSDSPLHSTEMTLVRRNDSPFAELPGRVVDRDQGYLRVWASTPRTVMPSSALPRRKVHEPDAR